MIYEERIKKKSKNEKITRYVTSPIPQNFSKNSCILISMYSVRYDMTEKLNGPGVVIVTFKTIIDNR